MKKVKKIAVDAVPGKPYIQTNGTSTGLIAICLKVCDNSVLFHHYKKKDFVYRVLNKDFKQYYQLLIGKEQIAEYHTIDDSGDDGDWIVKMVMTSGRVAYWTGKGWEPGLEKCKQMKFRHADELVEDIFDGSSLKPHLNEKYKISKEQFKNIKSEGKSDEN